MPRYLVTGSITQTYELDVFADDPRDAVKVFRDVHPDATPESVDNSTDDPTLPAWSAEVISICEACGRAILAGDPQVMVEINGDDVAWCGPCAESYTREDPRP